MIKIKNLIKEDHIKYTIYCDMDSVLTDFDAAFLSIADVKTKDGWEYKKKFGRDRFQSIINSKGLTFWSEMPWMADGKKLWRYINATADKVYILSSPSSHDKGESIEGKTMWCKKNLGADVNIILEEDKSKYSKKYHILIDDLDKNINPWRKLGGIGILHKSTELTIQHLKNI
jgi:hypothetical protein